MDLDVGIAGWILSGEILREKTLKLLEFPAVCASYGVKTVELCSRFFESQDAKYLNELRGELENNGLSVHNIAVDMGNISGADPAVRRTDVEALKQWFYTASSVGSKAIRINTGHADDEAGIQRVVDGYLELVEVGEQAGVKLLIENHGGISASPGHLTQILNSVDNSWFGTCPDTANFDTDEWEAGMEVLMPRAFSCHVKVFNYSDDGVQNWERNGESRGFNLRTYFEIMKGSNYSGPVCIESTASDDVREGIGKTLDYVKEQLAAV